MACNLVGPDDTAQAELVLGGISGRPNDVGALDAAQLLEKGAGAVAEAGAPHPLLEGLPQDVGQETDQDVRLATVGSVVPDWAHG